MGERRRSNLRSSVYRQFLNPRGLDGEPLLPYYNQKRTKFSDHFNNGELRRLRLTRKRRGFEWIIFIISFIVYLIGFETITVLGSITAIFYNFINFLLFWATIFTETFDWKWVIEIRERAVFFGSLLFLTFYMVGNQLFLFSKTVRDKIERAKLQERSGYLEVRIASTIVGYIRVNIVAAFVIRWLYQNGFVELAGIQDNTIFVWLRLAFENMINLLIISNIISFFGFETLSVKPENIYAKVFMVTIFLFNHFVALEAVLSTFKVLNATKKDKNGRAEQ